MRDEKLIPFWNGDIKISSIDFVSPVVSDFGREVSGIEMFSFLYYCKRV